MGAHPAAGPSEGPMIPNELFFAKVPPSLSLEVVQEVFHRFGSCQVTLFKRWATARTSKGCGIVTYADPAAAAAALEALHGKHRWPESEVPLVVEMMDQSRQKPAPPKAASTKQGSQQRSTSADGHSSSSSNACLPGPGCRPEQQQRHSPVSSSPAAQQQLFPVPWRQQSSSSSQPAAPSAATSADEDTMLQYVPFCSRNPSSSRSAGSVDSSWGSWESPGSVPVHLLPVTADIQAFVLRNELAACQQLKLQQEQPPQSAMPVMSLHEAAVAAGLLRGCSFGSGSLPSSEDIRAAAEQLARSTSSMVLSSSHSNAMSAASMAEVARAASTTALLAQQQQQQLLPEGLLQLSDPWIDASNNTSSNNSLCANAAALASAQGAGLFYGPQAAALQGRLAHSGSGSAMLLDGAPKHPGSQHAPGSAAPWPQDLLYQQQQAGLLLQAAAAPGGGSFGACAAAPAWNGGVAALPALQPQQQDCVSVDVSYALAGKAASTMGLISSMTRAHIEMVAVDGALKLAMTGTPDQLNQALHLYCLALG